MRKLPCSIFPFSIILASTLTFSGCHSGARATDANAAETPSATVVAVARGSIVRKLNLAGQFQPYQVIDVHAKVSGYIKLPLRVTLALSLAVGYNLQLTKDSKTYPDRYFFLGGGDSIRSFLADAVVPQDLIDKILRHEKKDNGKPFTIDDVTIRGGDFSVNPRVELRIPITDLFQAGVFLDAGNLWTKPEEIREFVLQYGVGAGVRFTTPIGPLAFDYGINPAPHYPWDSFGAFHFSIGLF